MRLKTRQHQRIDFQRDGYIILPPNGQWIKCFIIDVSTDGGVCLDIGQLETPSIFVLAMSLDGKVRRACVTVWRQSERLGARFLTDRELRGEADLLETELIDEVVEI